MVMVRTTEEKKIKKCSKDQMKIKEEEADFEGVSTVACCISFFSSLLPLHS